ncbi:MAG: hypothetical protein ACLQVW_31520, partial [Limisphaerales bacterium]
EVNNKTFRTLAYFIGLSQGTNSLTGDPEYVNNDFAGHNLVNLAMGRASDDTVSNQVLAMTFACDLSSARLVVYDKATSNVVATIADSTMINSVKQQDKGETGPNRAHFVAVVQLEQNGNATNGLVDGYFTIAGRLRLDPATGCPEPIAVHLDRDPLDGLVHDAEVPPKDDPDSVALTFRAGLAHAIGVVDAVTDGATNTVLVPFGGLSIRRELPVVTPVATPASE